MLNLFIMRKIQYLIKLGEKIKIKARILFKPILNPNFVFWPKGLVWVDCSEPSQDSFLDLLIRLTHY